MMEILSKSDCVLTLTGFFTLLSLLEHGYTYSLPAHDEGQWLNKERPEIFYDNKIIPERVEKNVYIYKTITNRFSFIKNQDNSPLAITVTPCASHVKWKITFRQIHSQLESTTENTANSRLIHLQNFTSESTNTYRDDSSQKGLYLIDLEPVTRETYARIYVTTTPDVDQVFPELPSDNRLNVTLKSNKEVDIRWNPSSTKMDHIEYCLVLSRKRQFYSNCGALAHLHGDKRPTLPPYTGFGFEGEKEKKKQLRKSAKPVRASPKGQIFYECVAGGDHSYTFKKAKAGRKYFINVFAVNRDTNTSISYAGSQVRLKRKGKRKRLELKEGQLQTFILKRKRTQKVQFRLERNMKVLKLVLQSCGGTLKARISKNRKKSKIARTNVKLLKTLTLRDMKSGTYQISFHGDKKKSGTEQTLTMLFYDNSSYTDGPRLPKSLQITAAEKYIRCDQARLAWTSSQGKQQYCIYQNELVKDSSESNENSHPKCTALTTRNKSQKVICKSTQHKTPNSEVITETIKKLNPGTRYIFSVYVGSNEREMFSYQSIIITTKSNC